MKASAGGYPRFQVEGGPARVALRVSRLVARAAGMWRQRGLGRIYQALARTPILGRQECVVEISPGTFFETGVFESFWAPTVIAGRPYEPELLHVLRRVGHLHPVLVDAGANYGFWSVVATSPEVGFAKAIAIEASPSTIRHLRANAARNPGRLLVVERAVAARSGERVRITHEWGHVGVAVVPAGQGDVDVETISIDDAVRAAGLWEHETFVLKLDVEGFELPALDGASELCAAREHAIAFEDFADSGRSGFEHVENVIERDYAVYYVSESGICERVSSVAEAHAVTRRHPKPGFSRNFFAVRRTGRFYDVFERWA